MERKAFTLLHDMEGSWWYQGRAAAIRSAIWRGTAGMNGAALDFGAGYGGMADELKRAAPSVDAYEPDAEASAIAKARGYARVYSSLDEVFARTYALIGLFDVVEHIEHDSAFIKQMHDALEPGGTVAITVPAFQFLWSVHDVHHHHYRRYTRKSMQALLEQNGFTVTFASYWNLCLFIPAALMRLVGKSSGESALKLPQVLNDLFLAIVYAEAFVMRFVPLPFGTGLVVVARKS